MQDIQSLFADYASFHRTKGNKNYHRIGIPLIMLTLIGMLVRVPLDMLLIRGGNLAMLLIALATIYYLVIEWRLALPMLAVSIAFYFLGAAMPLWLNAALFILGWIFQFIGHSVYEKKKPAFLRNFVHLLVGPLWILNDLIPVVKGVPQPR
jgi:uncharacterized membrane protein YGL010W